MRSNRESYPSTQRAVGNDILRDFQVRSVSTEKLVWWHFSDLHWEVRSSTERRLFLSALFDDLKRRLDEFGAPDFVVLSGDLTYAGEEAQFNDFEEHFVQRLVQMTSVIRRCWRCKRISWRNGSNRGR